MEQIFKGESLTARDTLKNIPQLLNESVAKFPDRAIFREADKSGEFKTTTYKDFQKNVVSLARAILEQADNPVVGVAGINSVQWSTVYFATLYAGGSIVPIDREIPVSEMLTILHYSGANMFFGDEKYMDELREKNIIRRKIEIVAMNSANCSGFKVFDDLLRVGAGSTIELPREYDTKKPGAICYTSGTTGQAKGVVLTQDNLIANVRQMVQSIDISEDDTFLSILPVHHTFEGTAGFLYPISCGSKIVYCRGIRHVAEDMVAEQVSCLLAVPLLWEAMYKKIYGKIMETKGAIKYNIGLSIAAIAGMFGAKGFRKKVFSAVHDKFGGKLRYCISGGAGIDAKVVAGFEKLGFTFLQGYGLTETAPMMTCNTINDNIFGSVGKVVPGGESFIDSPDGYGNGEIIVRGPNVMGGYYENKEETDKVLTEDGWFSTGDYGHFDKAGHLFITGRKKNVIIAKNGQNVYPEELEMQIGKEPLILECMAAGKLVEAKGEQIWMIIVPDMEKFIEFATEQGVQLTTEFIADYMKNVAKENNRANPLYKHIARIIIHEEAFPKTTTKKLKRREVLRHVGLSEEKSWSV